MKQLLYFVPVDFSPCSLNALQYAIMLARHAEGKVVLGHVVDLTEVPESDNPVVVSWSLDRLTHTAQKKMKSLCEMISLEGVPVEEDIVMGNIRQGILKQLARLKPTVIVLGRNTDREPGKHSMLTHISRNTRIPVLVVPGSHNPRVPNKALLATDLRPINLKDFNPVMNLIRNTAQQLAVININRADGDGAKAEAWIEKLNATYDVKASLAITDPASTGSDLEAVVQHNKVDLLCAIRQESLLAKLFGYDRSPVTVPANVPVLLVRK